MKSTITVRRHIVRPAFTLVELLVVVAIIALLIAILLPSLASAREKAQRAKCATNLRTLAGADFMYAQDYNGFVPRDSGAGGAPSVFFLLIQNQKIALTAGPATGGFESQYAAAYRAIRWLKCPVFPRSTQPVCYVDNAFDPNNIGHQISYLKLTAVRRPTETCNFTEGNANLPETSFDLYDLWATSHLTLNTAQVGAGANGGGRICSDNRHRGQVNISYFDGHVDSKPYKQKNGTSNLTLTDFVN
jgi:prepilin-type N-terminal cleavage/methylation domain-containing protein/prepilin-type processing-associated H-X9-DG protein